MTLSIGNLVEAYTYQNYIPIQQQTLDGVQIRFHTVELFQHRIVSRFRFNFGSHLLHFICQLDNVLHDVSIEII